MSLVFHALWCFFNFMYNFSCFFFIIFEYFSAIRTSLCPVDYSFHVKVERSATALALENPWYLIIYIAAAVTYYQTHLTHVNHILLVSEVCSEYC